MKILQLGLGYAFCGLLLFTACEKEVVVQAPTTISGSVAKTEAAGATPAAATTAQDLPPKVRQFLDQYYPNIALSKYEIKSLLGKKQYEVKLNNGVEIDFDEDGNWKEIKDGAGVPEVLVPAKIKTYVAQNYKGVKIESFNKNDDGKKMKVDLLNGVDLEFDLQGNFLRIDK